MKTIITILYAKLIRKRNLNWITNPIKYQNKTFHKLISKAKKTKFGTDHGFSEILSYETFKQNVPVRDYEGLKNYIYQVVDGKEDILWPG